MNHYLVFYAQVGRITTYWARTEAAIDFINLMIFRGMPGADALGSDLPVSFRPKIAKFEEYHKKLPHLSDLRVPGLALSGRAKLMKERRHDFVHGYVRRVGDDQNRTVSRLRLQGAGLRAVDRDYSPAEIAQLADDMAELRDLAHGHFLAVLALFPEDEINNIAS